MKKFLTKTLLTLFALLIIFPSFSFAQGKDVKDKNEQKEEVTVNKSGKKYFELAIENIGQSPLSKKVTYELKITPLISSPRTQVVWNVPSTLKAYPKHQKFISLQEGQTYSVKASIKPQKEGHHNLSVSVISWQHDTNYTNSIDSDLYFDKDLVTQPVTEQYKTQKVIMYVGIFLLVGVILFVAVLLVKKYTKKAKDWLTPDF